jgi:hypothetical protein
VLSFRSISSGSFFAFVILLIGMFLGLGGHLIYIICLCIVLLHLLHSPLRFYVPMALAPLLVVIVVLISFSFWFATSIVSNSVYSMLYVSSLLTVLFAYRFPRKSLHLIFFASCAFSGLIILGVILDGTATHFLIAHGIDTNFVGFFLVSGVFVIMKYPLCSLRMKKLLFVLFVLCGVLLMSRMVILMFGFLFATIYWDKSRFSKLTIISLGLVVLYLVINFLIERPILVEALISALSGDVNIIGLDSDSRRVGLFATGISYVAESFPWGSGMGPFNYTTGVRSEGLASSVNFRLGYPHNYYISIVAQAGLAGVIFIIYLLRTCYRALGRFPIITTICIGLAFNEFIGVPVLWLFIGLYLNEYVLGSSDSSVRIQE